VRLLSSTVEGGRVSLSWFSSMGHPGTVYRRQAGTSDWEARGQAGVDSTGTLSFSEAVDRAGRYAYRVGIVSPDAEVFSEAALVDVPSLALTLEPIAPNPVGARGLVVSFILPSPAAAKLELLDVSGRRLASSDVGSLGLGRHSVTLVPSVNLKSGVFLIRLTQSGRSVTRTAVRLH
jgi:hypothetical protein